MPKKLFGHCVAVTPSGDELVITGGFNGLDYSDVVLAYNFDAETWKTQDFRLSSPRYNHGCGLAMMRGQIQVRKQHMDSLHLHAYSSFMNNMQPRSKFENK